MSACFRHRHAALKLLSTTVAGPCVSWAISLGLRAGKACIKPWRARGASDFVAWVGAEYFEGWIGRYMAMGHNLWLYFGVDEHPFATYFDAHQKYRVLTHSHITVAL